MEQNELIQKFIKDMGLSAMKQSDFIIGVILEDINNKKMLIVQPLFTVNVIEVTIENEVTRYRYQKAIDGSYKWFNYLENHTI